MDKSFVCIQILNNSTVTFVKRRNYMIPCNKKSTQERHETLNTAGFLRKEKMLAVTSARVNLKCMCSSCSKSEEIEIHGQFGF